MPEFKFVLEDPAEFDSQPRKGLVQERAQPRLALALYKASVKSTADMGTIGGSSSTAGIDDAMLQRIKKYLQRASHTNTPEPEAKAASRLMGQYNVSQAEVLAHEPSATQQQYAVQSVVSIKRADGSINTVNRHAMTDFFDCKYYTERNIASMDWTFYGIAENTVAATISFKMAYSVTSEWARPYRGNSSKSIYCIGVAEELCRMACEEKCAQEN